MIPAERDMCERNHQCHRKTWIERLQTNLTIGEVPGIATPEHDREGTQTKNPTAEYLVVQYTVSST